MLKSDKKHYEEEGTITIGCDEFAAVETLVEICKRYKGKYPMVQIALHTATADSVYEMMNQGLAIHGLGYPVSIEGAAKYWREDLLIQRRLYPEITASTVIAWRRNIPYSLAMKKFIEEIHAFEA